MSNKRTVAINIDHVVRDFLSQFEKQYRKIFIHNPSLVGMTDDFQVKEATEEDKEKLNDKIKELEEEYIDLPVDSPDLTNHFAFSSERTTVNDAVMNEDGVFEEQEKEIVTSPEEALNNFMYQDYPFQVFGQAEEFEGAIEHVNKLQMQGLENGYFDVKLVSKLKNQAIPATFHFLSKNHCRIRSVEFVEDDVDKWNKCDILIDANPEAIQNVEDGKEVIKISREFNKWDEVENSFDNITDIKKEHLESVIDSLDK